MYSQPMFSLLTFQIHQPGQWPYSTHPSDVTFAVARLQGQANSNKYRTFGYTSKSLCCNSTSVRVEFFSSLLSQCCAHALVTQRNNR